MSDRQVPQEAVKAAAEWLGGDQGWAEKLLADALPAIRLQVLEEVEGVLLDNWDKDGSAVDEAAHHVAYGIPGDHAAWRGRTRGALSIAFAVVRAKLSEEKTDEEGGSDG